MSELHQSQLPESIRELLGYLNFSNGKPDPGFQRNVNHIFETLPALPQLAAFRDVLQTAISELEGTAPAFAELSQAKAVLALVCDVVLPAYREYHADLLFHLDDVDFEQPFFIARLFEAVLTQGSPWDEGTRISEAAIDQLNDFIGVRPIAVLENDRAMEPYSHERYRPTPLFLRDAGVAEGPYHDLIQRTIDYFTHVPVDIQREANFDLSRMDELAIDIRAYDHLHPVNKRTNYMFGEWDPHIIDTKGYYTRFVVRRIILDSLLSWMDTYTEVSEDERLHDAAAVLCGTMLMASSISGSGPDTHDSSSSLTSLLPNVARQRDLFYSHLLNQASGERAERLQREADSTRQPFGHVRKHLNIELAAYGAHQLHCRFLAQLFARMGSPEASRNQAAKIPSPAARIESEIGWRLTASSRQLDRGELQQACQLLHEIGDLLDRGIECGAIVDPWNILAFQGQFPLFHTREDAIPDQRIELLLDFLEHFFALYSQAMSEAAARGEAGLTEQLSRDFQKRAEWWDQFAASVVEELPKVRGVEIWKSACAVAEALRQWRQAGESAGDISFWRKHVDAFQSPSAYGRVVNTLLEKGDHIAAMGLLMQWLSQAEEVSLEESEYSFYTLIVRWTRHVADQTRDANLSPAESWKALKRLFDYLEANAGEFWSVPTFNPNGVAATPVDLGDDDEFDEGLNEDDDSWQEDDEESELYGAAYEGVVFRDSAEDGNEGDTLDEGFRASNSEIEIILRSQEVRLGFLKTLAELWEISAKYVLSAPRNSATSGRSENAANSPISVADEETLTGWTEHVRTLERGLIGLLVTVSDYEMTPPSGDYDSNYEYDIQMQARHTLQHHIAKTVLSCRKAGWWLQACLPELSAGKQPPHVRQRIASLFGLVFRQDVVRLRNELPGFMKWLSKQPLLYVPLENDGDPKRFLAIRTMQTVLRLLLAKLAGLGLLNEVRQLLQTAHRMERTNRPSGMATTEFDQLFKIGLKGSLECVVRTLSVRPRLHLTEYTQISSNRRYPAVRIKHKQSLRKKARRKSPRQTLHARRQNVPRIDAIAMRRNKTSSRRGRPYSMGHKGEHDLVPATDLIVGRFQKLWINYSQSIRISSVEVLRQEELWDNVKEFIEQFGDDFFHTPMLMVSNLRSILHLEIESYLDYLAEEDDPLHPNSLLEAIDSGEIERETACRYLELVYECVLDKLERFIEYNTTTTQSDYGHLLYCLLDFLRAESGYDRDDWLLKPYKFAHAVLTETGQVNAATKWETLLGERSREKADEHCQVLEKLEKTYGVCLPSLADHLDERFVKSLAVNRMQALLPKSLSELRQPASNAETFGRLCNEIQQYLDSTSGSAIEVPDWLLRLDREIQRFDRHSDLALNESAHTFGEQPPVTLRPRQLSRRLTRRSRFSR